MSASKRDPMIFHGKIISGSGMGGYYLEKPEFSVQFERILGSRPFPGTLNVQIEGMSESILNLLCELKRSEGTIIHGFERNEKHYFPGISLPCRLMVRNKVIASLIIFPEKTVHPPDILELIAVRRILDHAEIGEEVTIRA